MCLIRLVIKGETFTDHHVLRSTVILRLHQSRAPSLTVPRTSRGHGYGDGTIGSYAAMAAQSG